MNPMLFLLGPPGWSLPLGSLMLISFHGSTRKPDDLPANSTAIHTQFRCYDLIPASQQANPGVAIRKEGTSEDKIKYFQNKVRKLRI
jgi:hypothetical protein